MKIKVKKETVVSKLFEHMQKHYDNYNKMLPLWEEAYNKEQKQPSSYNEYLFGHLPEKPGYHEKDYQSLIRMVEKHIDETIILDEEDYEKVFNDKWKWSHKFNGCINRYLEGV